MRTILQLACAIRHSDDLAVAELGARESEGGWGRGHLGTGVGWFRLKALRRALGLDS